MDTNSFVEKARYTGKMIVVGVLVIISFIGSLFVLGIVNQRQGTQQEAEQEVASAWGKPQLVAGPVIMVPTTLYYSPGAGAASLRRVLYILPSDLQISTNVTPEVRKRGIFSAPVYTGTVKMAGSFDLPNLADLGLSPGQLLWNEATINVGLSDTRSVSVEAGAHIGTALLPFNPGSELWNVDGMGIHSKFPIGSFAGSREFEIDLNLTGSKGLYFVPLGENTIVDAGSSWKDPSFVGAYLPDKENVTATGFTSQWHVSALGRSYPSAWLGTGEGIHLSSYENYSYNSSGAPYSTKPLQFGGTGDNYVEAITASTFGVNFYQNVTFYTLVERTVKYAILFIALTFLAFYLFEVTAKMRIHPFQYLLIGAALVLFYLLLLSFSEHLGFGYAYLLSSFMTIGLATWYSASVLKAHSRAWIVAALLAVLYAYLYAILQLENYALLFGTLFLFVALAAVMYATRKIEWYREQ